MTCIAAIVKDGRVFIGADSSGVSGSHLEVRADEKVFVNGPFVIGFSSSFRMGQLLRYEFEPPPHEPSQSLESYMVTVFIKAARRCLDVGGCLKRENSIESGGQFLVGTEGRLFSVDSDFQVGMLHCAYDAIGSGHHLALGALSILSRDKRLNPQRTLTTALKVAESFCSEVRGPFVVRSTKGRGK